MSGQMMEFPETFERFAKEYGFKDDKEVYTNGLDLIPVYRVQQWLEHDNNENKWIPVSERLPEENKTVIVSTDYGVVYPEARYTKENDWEWHCDPVADYWASLVYVTAWMTLPEPYKSPKSDGEENLKPCPFCGSSNVKVYNKYGSDEFVKCNNCGVTTAADEREKVIKLWNTRCS